jgi:hypothetical protein
MYKSEEGESNPVLFVTLVIQAYAAIIALSSIVGTILIVLSIILAGSFTQMIQNCFLLLCCRFMTSLYQFIAALFLGIVGVFEIDLASRAASASSIRVFKVSTNKPTSC